MNRILGKRGCINSCKCAEHCLAHIVLRKCESLLLLFLLGGNPPSIWKVQVAEQATSSSHQTCPLPTAFTPVSRLPLWLLASVLPTHPVYPSGSLFPSDTDRASEPVPKAPHGVLSRVLTTRDALDLTAWFYSLFCLHPAPHQLHPFIA